MLRKSYGFAGRREDASRLRAEARKEAEKWHEGKTGKEELVGEGGAKLPDWEGQPIRNLRSIKLEWEVRTRLSFIAMFVSPSSLTLVYPFFLILVFALLCCSFVLRARPRNPFLHLKELADTPFRFPEHLDINRR